MGNKTTTPTTSYAVIIPENFYIPIAPDPNEPNPFTTTIEHSSSYDPPIFAAPTVNPTIENHPPVVRNSPDTWPNFGSSTHTVPVSSPPPIIPSTTVIPSEHPHTDIPKASETNAVPVNLEAPRAEARPSIHDQIFPSIEKTEKKISEELGKKEAVQPIEDSPSFTHPQSSSRKKACQSITRSKKLIDRLTVRSD